MLVYEFGDGIGREVRGPALEEALEGLAAHEGNHEPRGVVGAGVVSAGDQFLEHLAQHLGVDCDFNVEGCGLHDGEVELVEELVEYLKDALIGDYNVCALVRCRLVEQAAVKERDGPIRRVSEAGLMSMERGLLRPLKKSGRSLSLWKFLPSSSSER